MGKLFKHLLSYDSSNLAGSDQVGAHILSGTQEIGAVADALKVSVENDIGVNLDGIYALVTNLTPDSVGIIGHTRSATPTAVEQVERSTVGPLADAVVNADVHALDVASFMMGWNGTTWDRVKTTDGVLQTDFSSNLIADDAVDSGGSLKIGSRYMATLTALSANGDRGDLISDIYRRIYVNDSSNKAGNLLKPTVSATASQADGTALVGRKSIFIQNLSDKDIYLGVDNTVTASTGILIPKNGEYSEYWGENIQIWLISAGAISSNVRVLELA